MYERSDTAKTSGRFLVAPIEDAYRRGHLAALGYFDTLPAACEFAHAFSSPRSPVGVWDSESPARDDWHSAQLAHRTA